MKKKKNFLNYDLDTFIHVTILRKGIHTAGVHKSYIISDHKYNKFLIFKISLSITISANCCCFAVDEAFASIRMRRAWKVCWARPGT